MLDDYSMRVFGTAVWVIEEGTRILGVLVLLPKLDHLLLDNIAVAPPHQGLGLGRRLLPSPKRNQSGGAIARSASTRTRR
jgi:GNAT superfamily N-acetyltransferase